jgi:hypothetical protein
MAYNAFEHLWRSVIPITATEKVMAMLTAHFDESGKDGKSPILLVGGYLSTVERWEEFQREWQQFLIDEHIEKYHTTDILARQKEFKSWTSERVNQVFRKVDDLTMKHTLAGVAGYVDIAVCESVHPLIGRSKYSYEYALAGTMAATRITAWAHSQGYNEPIDFVFDRGTTGRGIIIDALDAARESQDPELRASLIGGISFEDKNRVPQLHLADKLANLVRASVNRLEKGQDVEDVIKRLLKSHLKTVEALERREDIQLFRF